MTEFFILYALSTVLSAALGIRPLTLMQSNGYKYKPSRKSCIGIIAETAVVGVSSAAYVLINGNLRIIGAAVLFVFLVVKLFSDWFGRRTKPVFTKRFQRLLAVYFAITAAVFISVGIFHSSIGKFLLLFSLTHIIAEMLALAVTSPFERLNSQKYIERTKRFFANSVGILKIGITGSAGKTSVKNMLVAALSKKYSVIATEKNFNTPLGIARTVSKYNGERIFIAEMGARRVGDVKELCEIVRPDIGIVTAVLPQHLETFGSLENIAAEKGELANSATLFAVLNGEDEKVAGMNTGGEKITVGKGGNAYVKDAEYSVFGTGFTYVDQSGEHKMYLPIAGLFTAQNAALAIAVARELGVSFGEIQAGFSEMKQIPHRLEVTRNAAGITIVDDAYNSNVAGAKAALELLSMTKGRKIVIAQGVVEMGKEREAANREIGAALAKASDVTVFTGINAKYLSDGYFANGGRGETYFAKNLEKAQEIFSGMLKRGDIVFFQNDIPDNY